MITTSGITMQYGARPLFDNVSVKFGGGNRYGLIGANGSGKSTFMKILGGELEPSSGNVAIDANERIGRLRQDQFAYEDQRVLDVVLMGHEQMWAAMSERDAIYANADATEDDYMKAADLEAKFAEYGGYDSEARAGALLFGLGIPEEQHRGPMSAVAPGWKLRVLLAQALFADPDILLLDEPTNNLDINSIRWLENMLDQRQSTIIIISHDRHFLNAVCTHMADLDYGGIRVYPGSYDDYMLASTQARQQVLNANAKAKERISDLQDFVARFSANKSKARQATSRQKQIEKLKVEDVKPSSRQYPFIRFDYDEKEKLHRHAVEVENLAKGYGKPLFHAFNLIIEAGEKVAILGPNGVGKTTLLRCLWGDLKPDGGKIRWTDKARVLLAGTHGRFRRGRGPHRLDGPLESRHRRGPDRAQHARAAALLGRRGGQVDQGGVRGRGAAPDLRQAHAAEAQCAFDGRADQPPRHGIDRIAQHGPRQVQGHADLRLARPGVRVVARHADYRYEG